MSDLFDIYAWTAWGDEILERSSETYDPYSYIEDLREPTVERDPKFIKFDWGELE